MGTKKGKNINKENVEKLALKREGHSLIDRIKWKGYSKQAVYYMLADKMGIEERHAHFMAMNTLRELRAAVIALRWLNEHVPKTAQASGIKHKHAAQEANKKVELPLDALVNRHTQAIITVVARAQPLPPPPAPKVKKPAKLHSDESIKVVTRGKKDVLPQSAYMAELRKVAKANNARLQVKKPNIMQRLLAHILQ